MINTDKLNKSIQNLDELSLYLEICKYKNTIKSLKEDLVSNVGNELKNIQRIEESKEALALHMMGLVKFGIDYTDKDTVNSWMSSCNQYLNQLDMVEYATFLRYRGEALSLEKFAKAEPGKSAFLKQEEKLQNTLVKQLG